VYSDQRRAVCVHDIFRVELKKCREDVDGMTAEIIIIITVLLLLLGLCLRIITVHLSVFNR